MKGDLEEAAEAAEAGRAESDRLAESLAALEARIEEETAAHNTTLTDLKAKPLFVVVVHTVVGYRLEPFAGVQ